MTPIRRRLPDVGVLPLRDVQVGHVAVEPRFHKAVVVVELRVLDRFLSCADSLIDVAQHPQGPSGRQWRFWHMWQQSAI